MSCERKKILFDFDLLKKQGYYSQEINQSSSDEELKMQYQIAVERMQKDQEKRELIFIEKMIGTVERMQKDDEEKELLFTVKMIDSFQDYSHLVSYLISKIKWDMQKKIEFIDKVYAGVPSQPKVLEFRTKFLQTYESFKQSTS
jgi:hypothetical protein